jgi:outer membrane protein TolC
MLLNRLSAAALLAILVPIVSLPAGETRTVVRPINHSFTGDLPLDEAVKIALRQNPNILKQLQEIERTRGLIIEARAAALPHLTLNATYDQEDKNLVQQSSSSNGGSSGSSTGLVVVPVGNVPPNVIDDVTDSFAKILRDLNSNQRPRVIQNKSWLVSLEVQQVLYSGGQVRAAIKIAKFAEDSAYYQLRDTIDTVVATVRSQFTTVLTNRALIKVAEETVKLQEDQLRDQKNRFEAGTVPRFNVLRAEVALANVLPDLIRARNNYLLAEIALAKSLGLNPGPAGGPTFNAVGELQIPERRFALQAALELARARRPFLKVQRQLILQQTEQIKIALAGYKPTLNGNAGYEVLNSSLSDDLSDTVNGWFFGFTGQWNIFDGLATYGRVKQARAQLESAKINYDDSVQQVDLEVQTAYANLRTARETIKSQQKNVEQAVEALRLAQERFAAGAGTQLEILDARTALTQAASTELQSRGDYNTALAEFDRATATDTVYAEQFHDPLHKLERKILGDAPVKVTTVRTKTAPKVEDKKVTKVKKAN